MIRPPLLIYSASHYIIKSYTIVYIQAIIFLDALNQPLANAEKRSELPFAMVDEWTDWVNQQGSCQQKSPKKIFKRSQTDGIAMFTNKRKTRA
jgi:hypothetical protein